MSMRGFMTSGSFVEKALVESLRKERRSLDYPFWAKVRYVGTEESSAKPWIVIQCDEQFTRFVRRFFRQEWVKDLAKSHGPPMNAWEILVLDRAGAPADLALKDTSVFTAELNIGNCLSDQYVLMQTENGPGTMVSLGGIIEVESQTGDIKLYGLTCGHFQYPVPDGDNNSYKSSLDDDSESDAEQFELEWDDSDCFKHNDLESCEAEEPSAQVDRIERDEHLGDEPHAREYDRPIGKVVWSSYDDNAVTPNLDWALVQLNPPFPTELDILKRFISPVISDFDVTGRNILHDNDGVVPNPSIKIRVDIRRQQFPATYGYISPQKSMFMPRGGTDFIKVHSVKLDNGACLQPGDCGRWVIDEKTGQLFGFVVAVDAFGDVCVIPIVDTFRCIRAQIGAQALRIPSADKRIRERNALIKAALVEPHRYEGYVSPDPNPLKATSHVAAPDTPLAEDAPQASTDNSASFPELFKELTNHDLEKALRSAYGAAAWTGLLLSKPPGSVLPLPSTEATGSNIPVGQQKADTQKFLVEDLSAFDGEPSWVSGQGASASQAMLTTKIKKPWRITAANKLACFFLGITHFGEEKYSILDLLEKNSGTVLRKLESSSTSKPAKRDSEAVVLCGDIARIEGWDSTFKTASMWVKRVNNSLIWVIEEVTEDVAYVTVDDSGHVMNATGAIQQLWGTSTLARGSDIRTYIPELQISFGSGLDYGSIVRTPGYTTEAYNQRIPVTVNCPSSRMELRVSSFARVAGIICIDPQTLEIFGSNSVFSSTLFGREQLEGLDINSLIPGFSELLHLVRDEWKIGLTHGSYVPRALFTEAKARLTTEQPPISSSQPSNLTIRHRDGSEIPVSLELRVSEQRLFESSSVVGQSQVSSFDLLYILWISFSRPPHRLQQLPSIPPLNSYSPSAQSLERRLIQDLDGSTAGSKRAASIFSSGYSRSGSTGISNTTYESSDKRTQSSGTDFERMSYGRHSSEWLFGAASIASVTRVLGGRKKGDTEY